MSNDTSRHHEVEIIPPQHGARERQAGEQDFQAAAANARAMSPLLRSAIVLAALAGGIALLAILVAFAATVALIAIPAALVAGGVAWLTMRWRAWKQSRG